MRKNSLLNITFTISFVIIGLLAQAQTTTSQEKTGLVLGGFNYQVQEFQLLNQQIGDDCNCLEGTRLNKRAIQSVNLSVLKLNNNWAWSAALGYASGNVMNDAKIYDFTRLMQTRMDVYYHFAKPENRLRPFVGAGLQLAFHAKSNLFSLPLGAGLRYRFKSGAYLHWQTSYDYGFAQNLAQNLITQVGIHWPLGKSRKQSETSSKPVNEDPSAAQLALVTPAPKPTAADTTAAQTNDAAKAQAEANKEQLAANTSAPVAKPTLPVSSQTTADQPTQQPALSKVVYFYTDKWSLTTRNALTTLNEVLVFAQTYPQTILLLSGHTDSVLGQAYNLALSKRRVVAVKQWLLSKGINASRIQISYNGKSSPANDNETEAGRALNRRVEITVK